MTVLPRPFDRWTTYPGHGGIDYPAPRGTLVRASGPGFIDFSGYYSPRGGFAKFITYDCGCRHGYYHFDSDRGLGVGARVDYGTPFAFVGSLGLNSTGPHLHHEVWNGHAGIIRPPAYWEHVDQSRYVGDGSTAGDEHPFIPPTQESEEDDDMPKNSGFYYTRAKDRAVVCMVVNTGSGFISEHSNGKAANGEYNNPIAGAYDTGSWAPITESHANAIKASLRAVQRVEISIPEPVEIV